MSIAPDSIDGQIMLKDMFITQRAPDIKKKLQKVAFALDSSRGTLVKTASF